MAFFKLYNDGVMPVDIKSDISLLKGVGPKTKEALNKCSIYTIEDLLLYFPRDYEVVVKCHSGSDIGEEKVVVTCKVIDIRRDVRTSKGKTVSSIVFDDGSKIIIGKWFNQPYIKNSFRINCEYNLLGKIVVYKNESTMINPRIIKEIQNENIIIPKYSLSNDLTSNIINKLISQVLYNVTIKENLPLSLIKKYNLCSLDEAVKSIHMPKNNEKLEVSRKRLKFQELFLYSMKIMILKYYIKNCKRGIPYKMSPELSKLKEKLPFKLTEAQNRTIREILIDQKREYPMNRLVQGDVGSGKTIVAIVAMFNVVKNGFQAALMAPTEILASQHYNEVCKILNGFDINVKLLTGSMSAAAKKSIKEELRIGMIDIIIGTHALLEEDVEFSHLGMIVADEQHRFGVNQRTKLFNKNAGADVLVMTATPIPRTLALYVYGDLDLSVIDELPPGRKKIKTMFVDIDKKGNTYNFVIDEIKKGRQAYVVCPLIEENEDLQLNSVDALYEELKVTYLKGIRVERLHGKMTPKEKDQIMASFKQGEIDVLIATTVIEVGVNVPNASIMIIENAERFGLSQLHQLRGRVGRGSYESYCILLANAKNNITKKRMEIMTESNDGFYISEEDMKLRGSGDIFGFRQSGEDGLVLSDLFEDINLLKAANEEARRLMRSTSEEDVKIIEYITGNLQRSSKLICFN
jgi:ATP-dependent DNA helicase RecG